MAKKRVSYVSIHGEKFNKLTEWKKNNPNTLWFESNLERECYLILKENKLNFEFHPESRVLQESFKTLSLQSSKVKKNKLFRASVRPITYTPDFIVHCNDGTKVFLETKGFFYKDARLRYKIFQASLKDNEITLILKNKKDINDAIDVINEEFNKDKSPKTKKITDVKI